MQYIDKAREVLDLEIQGLSRVRDALDAGALGRAVDILLASLARGGKIVVTGVGKSLLIGEKISATLASTGATSVVLHPTQAMHGDLGMVSRGDVLLVLSYSGASDELLRLVPLVRRLHVSIVTLTGDPKSALAELSDAVLPVTVEREACPFNMAPTTSTTATLAVGDALAMVLLDARGFDREDYAKLHPGGAIGRALLLRVGDIMRTGERVATVGPDDPVKTALLAMTQARSGSAAVVDGDGRLLGIFTDGDLRRHLARRTDLLDTPMRDVMTPRPISATPEDLAVNVLKLFEDHNIDDVLVMDRAGKLVGAVDIQDLPRLKIM